MIRRFLAVADLSATEIVCHMAMLIETLAFVQTDLFKLRAIETLASLLLFSYAIAKHGKSSYKDCHAWWSFIHICVNVYKMIKSKRREHRVMSSLTVEEKSIRETFFPNYTVAHFVELREMWEFKHYSRGDMILHEGEEVEFLSLIYSGECSVTAGGIHIANVGAGQYIGEMAFFTRDPASASLWANNNVVIIQWNLEDIRQLSVSLKRDVQAQAFAMLPAQFCKDLTHKLAGINKASTGIVKDAILEDIDEVRDPESVANSTSEESKSGGIRKKASSKVRPMETMISVKPSVVPNKNVNLPKHLQKCSRA